MVKTTFMKLKDLNNDLSWFIIKAITKHTKKVSKNLFPEVDGWDDNLGKDMDIKLSVNGVELDFIECWKDFEEAWEIGVKKKAKERFENSMFDVYKKLYDKVQSLDNYIDRKINELFPDLEDED